MDEEQEITVKLGGWKASIKIHNYQEFSAKFADQETGIINRRNASISCWSRDYDLYLD